jgi:hypothetical protein
LAKAREKLFASELFESISFSFGKQQLMERQRESLRSLVNARAGDFIKLSRTFRADIGIQSISHSAHFPSSFGWITDYGDTKSPQPFIPH